MKSYGKSDFFQFEQISNFFTNSFEIKEFHRINRIKTRRLIQTSEDLAIKEKSLNYVEEEILKIKFPGWSRKFVKERINKRLMTKYKSEKWQENYSYIVQACVCDTLSALLLMIAKKF